jgi:hypothetical protein
MTSKPTIRTISHEEMEKIKQLIHSKTVDNVKQAIHLLQSVDASPGQWAEAFSSETLNHLWRDNESADPELFKLLADTFHSSRVLTRMLVESLDHPHADINWEYLTNLSEATAEVLADLGSNSCIKSELRLNKLTSLSDKAAEALSAIRCTYLHLDGLISLSDKAAASLSTFRGDWLYLKGLISLSDNAAKSLSLFKGSQIRFSDEFDEHLDRLTCISDKAAEAFNLIYKESELRLNGLSNISSDVAESLGRHNGELHLNGLKSLSEEIARGLSKHNGNIYLNGLESLSDEVARILTRNCGGLCLCGLTHISDNTLIELSKVNGDLWLGALVNLSNLGAKALSRVEGDLCLCSLISLTDEAAEALGSHKGGVLDLSCLKNISDKGGRSLCNHREDIYLDYEILQQSAAEILRDHFENRQADSNDEEENYSNEE